MIYSVQHVLKNLSMSFASAILPVSMWCSGGWLDVMALQEIKKPFTGEFGC